MGIRLQLSPHLISLLNLEDQKLYGETIAQTTVGSGGIAPAIV